MKDLWFRTGMADEITAHLEGLGRHALDHLQIFTRGARIEAEAADPRYTLPGTNYAYWTTRTFISGDYKTLEIRAADLSVRDGNTREGQQYQAQAILTTNFGAVESWNIPFAGEVFTALKQRYRLQQALPEPEGAPPL